MDIIHFRDRLLDIDRRLSVQSAQSVQMAREQLIDTASDIAEQSVADESVSEDIAEAVRDGTVLEQVRDALKRIDDGTFGRCVVDGGPIEPERLDALPWTPYCLRHQKLLEIASGLKTPTL